jgi:hypothetical protein
LLTHECTYTHQIIVRDVTFWVAPSLILSLSGDGEDGGDVDFFDDADLRGRVGGREQEEEGHEHEHG